MIGRTSRDRRRTLTSAACVASLAALALAGASSAAAAEAPDLIATYRVMAVKCVPGPANTVRAQVQVRMRVVNYEGFGGDWADRMEAKARLVPTTAGFNFTRRWVSARSDYLTTNRTHTRVMTLTTDNVSGTRAWKLQLKLIWARPAGRDVKRQLSLRFNGGCAPQTGMMLPAAPALPSAGGA